MTCQELRDDFEGDLRVGANRLSAVELVEHVAACPSCNRFVEGQKELEEHLRAVRDSAPPIPDSLDNTVVTNYRSFVLEQSRLAKSTPLSCRINPRIALGWAAAVAFAVAVAYGAMLLFIPGQHAWVDRQDTVRQPMVAPVQGTADKEAARARIATRKALKSRGGSAKHANHLVLLAEKDKSPPIRFQSLMYCDQISCPGAMEVIRVQLPSPVMGLTPTSSGRMGAAVSADVLVGPDGIARGIRVVE